MTVSRDEAAVPRYSFRPEREEEAFRRMRRVEDKLAELVAAMEDMRAILAPCYGVMNGAPCYLPEGHRGDHLNDMGDSWLDAD